MVNVSCITLLSNVCTSTVTLRACHPSSNPWQHVTYTLLTVRVSPMTHLQWPPPAAVQVWVLPLPLRPLLQHLHQDLLAALTATASKTAAPQSAAACLHQMPVAWLVFGGCACGRCRAAGAWGPPGRGFAEPRRPPRCASSAGACRCCPRICARW